jgi:hypothetical protein
MRHRRTRLNVLVVTTAASDNHAWKTSRNFRRHIRHSHDTLKASRTHHAALEITDRAEDRGGFRDIPAGGTRGHG